MSFLSPGVVYMGFTLLKSIIDDDLCKNIALWCSRYCFSKIGITIFYEIFPPENYNSTDHVHAISAAIVGVICASIFLVLMVRSVTSDKNK